MTHTPHEGTRPPVLPNTGPWYYRHTEHTGQSYIADETSGRTVAIVYDQLDAPKIAAAPTLLDALKYCAGIIESLPPDMREQLEDILDEDIQPDTWVDAIRLAEEGRG